MASSSSGSASQLGNSFNAETEMNLLPQWGQPPHGDVRTWDIFVSHSGAQKGFAKDLFKTLGPLYEVFFDMSHYSLPLSYEFPPLIFHAAKTCKLALVVLSKEFFSRSKWPMIELSAFIDAGVKVLPLFYELSPHDLKDNEKRQEWREMWEYFASQDHRIEVSSWDRALRKLGSINGLVFKKLDGELAFLEEIMLAIYQLVPLPFKSSHDGIRGKDRLCKEIIDKFEQLEQRRLSPSSADRPKVYLLGVYGLPGSGKTTLCGCLRNRFFSAFAGKAVHLKLPSNPTPADLLESAKQLFELTNFGQNWKDVLLSKLVDLPQVFSVLRNTDLQNSRVFVVIDNITSQESIELVEAILHLGVGNGSRVMVVARSLDTLHPLLNIPKDQLYYGHIHYVCGSMRVPSVNKEEATAILMQPAGGLGLALNYNSIIEEKYSARHREIITRVTRMCAFGNNSVPHRYPDDLYVPQVLKIIGSQLRSNGMDLEQWERRLSQFDTLVKNLKEDAVRKIVDYSYENLHQNLKLIFLDVALFLVPYYSHSLNELGYEEAVELLSFMHERDTETIKGQIKDLTRLCFFDLGFSYSGQQILSVGDFFLEFAHSLADASSRYRCRRRYMGAQDAQEVTLDLCRMVWTSNANLRSLILEVDEKCERFDFPEGLSSVKAVVVRSCKSLAALGLAGLTSLAILSVEDCPKLRCVEFDPSHTYTLRSVKWALEYDPLQRSSLQSLQHEKAGKATQLIKRGWCSMRDLCAGYWPQRPLNGLMTSASRLKALQVLRLHWTGITSLRDLSSYWPQLRVLEVLEDRLEEIELGYLPHLRRLFFGDEELSVFTNRISFSVRIAKSRTRAGMSKRPKSLVARCPELEDLRICGASCQIPSPNLRTMWLRGILCGEPVLPDLTSSAHSLEEIVVSEHRVLQRIDFTHQFMSLVRICVRDCPNLVKVTGLECLPRLRYVEIFKCSELQAVENLEGLRMLEELDLGMSYSCPNVQVATTDLETLSALRHAECKVFGKPLKLHNLGSLESLKLEWEICEGQAAKQVLLYCGSSSDAKCEHANEINAQLQSMQYVPLFVVAESAPACLSLLELYNVRDLICLYGVHRLLSLKTLILTSLPQLTCLQGLECLINLQDLDIEECTAVERLPSLCTLVNMRILSIVKCGNLKSLEGLECLINLQHLAIKECTAVERLPSLCTLVNMRRLWILKCGNLKSLEGCDKMGSIKSALFCECENLEHCPFVVAESPQPSCPRYFEFYGCKFASMKAMVGWILDDEVASGLQIASLRALVWELAIHLREKPKERMEWAEQLVETVGVYCASKLVPALTDDNIFDFQHWVKTLDEAWTFQCDWRKSEGILKKPSFPRGMQVLMEEIGRVPLKGVLQQCKSDAQFRTSVARCLLETDYEVLFQWIHWILTHKFYWSTLYPSPHYFPL